MVFPVRVQVSSFASKVTVNVVFTVCYVKQSLFLTWHISVFKYHLPWWLSDKESPCNAWDMGIIPRSGRSPGGGRGNPLQYSRLENPMDRGAWRATVNGVTRKNRSFVAFHSITYNLVERLFSREHAKID